MKRVCIVAGFIIVCCLIASYAYPKDVYIIQVQGVINPPSAGFISESIEKSEKMEAEALVILLDTPGGLDTRSKSVV